MASFQTLAVDHPESLKDDEVSQEIRDLIASLPSQSGWFHEDMRLYQGFWYPPRIIKGVIASQKQFIAQDSDVLLVTPPKSGTTWIKALTFALMNRGKYMGKNKHPLLENSPHDLVRSLEFDLYAGNEGLDLSELESPSPRLFATHMPFSSLPESVKQSNCKIIYMGRNLKDTLISLWHFMNKLKYESMEAIPLEAAFSKFCKGETPFGPVWEHLLEYWKESLKNCEKIMFLKFEEMKENPGSHARKIAEFLGCPFSSEEDDAGVVDDILKLCSFETLSNLEVNQGGKLSNGYVKNIFFRKGDVGDWTNYMSPEMVDEMNRISEEKLSKFELKL